MTTPSPAARAHDLDTTLFTHHFEGTPKAAALIAGIREFVATELEPLVEARGITHETGIDRATLKTVWRRAHALGYYGMTLPESMGGAGLSIHDHALVKEAIYATGSPLAPHILGELSGPPRVGALVKHATPAQFERFILPVARADRSICFALTESDSGSDAGALQTRAVLAGSHYLMNGRKRFISGSPFADYAILMASTAEPDQAREVSAFFVDLATPGIEVVNGYKTMAGQTSTGDIVLTDARIPADNLIGRPGRGLGLALGRITVNRLLHCPAMIGLATVALRDARDYAIERHQFGQAIGQFQAIQHMLANMATQLAAARALMLGTARQLDAGIEGRAQSSMAKLFCSEACFQIADTAVQIHGGEGIVQGRRVEFIFRMLRMYRVLTGTSEIQRNTIARELLTGLQT